MSGSQLHAARRRGHVGECEYVWTRTACGSGVHPSPRLPVSPPALISSLPAMYPLDYPEPPTEATIAHARAHLASYDHDARILERQIQDARDALARIIEERQCAIRDMERDLLVLEDKVAYTKAYVSPFKRLPHELLRHIFLYVFEDSATSAWVLSAVCLLWRRLALSMPKLWSKVCPPPSLPPLAAARMTHACYRPPPRSCLPLGSIHSAPCSVRSPSAPHAR